MTTLVQLPRLLRRQSVRLPQQQFANFVLNQKFLEHQDKHGVKMHHTLLAEAGAPQYEMKDSRRRQNRHRTRLGVIGTSAVLYSCFGVRRPAS